MPERLDDTQTLGRGEEDLRDVKIARLLGEYADRLARGETEEAERFLKQHADLSPEIEAEIRALNAVGGLLGCEPREKLGDFETLREIGRGGMGVVYEARQLSLDRRVALKILPAGLLGDPRAVARFHREARIAASLHHSNIVPVYATGVEGRTPYFAMELCEGETLQLALERMESLTALDGDTPIERLLFGSAADAPKSPVLARDTPESPRVSPGQSPRIGSDREGSDARRGRRPLLRSRLGLWNRGSKRRTSRLYCLEVARLFAGAAEGLQHAHDLKVIHRDLKPSNLMLEIDGRLRVLDFSLAWVADGQSLTLPRDRLGTPSYMSPEQARGDNDRMGPTTDIYSLGATLYAVLTLRPPFNGRDCRETLYHVVHTDPIPPRRLNPEIPRDLETVVLKCLRKDPKDRFGTAEALAQELHRVARGAPVETRPQPMLERLTQWAWQRRRRVGGWAAVLALLVSLALLLGGQWDSARQRRLDHYEKKVIGAVKYLVRRELRSPLVAFGKVKAESLDLNLEPEEPIKMSPEQGGYNVLLRAGCELVDPADADDDKPKGFQDKGQDELRRARELLEEAARDLPDQPDAYYHLARVASEQGRSSDALDYSARAIAVAPRFVPGIELRARLMRGSGDGAKDFSERAARLAKGTWAEPWLAIQGAVEMGQWAEAANTYEAVLTREGELRGASPYAGWEFEALIGAGLANFRAQNFGKAVQLLGAAESKFGGSLELDILLAKVDYLANPNASAIRSDDRLVKRFQMAAIPESDAIAAAAANAYLDVGELSKAREWVEHVSAGAMRVSLKKRILLSTGRLGGQNNLTAVLDSLEVADLEPGEPWAKICLGNAYLSIRGFDEAEKAFGQARDLAPNDPRPLIGLGACAYARHKMEESRRWFEAALRLEPNLVQAHYNLGVALDGLGLSEEAERCYLQALRRNPSHALSRNNLGIGLDIRGLFDAATKEYERAVADAPLLDLARYNLARGLQRQGHLSRAAVEYREASKLGMKDPVVHKNLANCLYHLGRFREAKVEYAMALTVEPKNARILHGLGVTLLQLHNRADALDDLKQAAELEPAWVDALNDYAWDLDLLGRSDEALREYLKIIRLSPGFVHAFNNLANLFLKERRPLPQAAELVELLRLFETASLLPGADPAVNSLVEKCREALEPDLATYASIDAFLDRPDPLVGKGAEWSYRRGEVDLEWMSTDYDDSAWDKGAAGFGFREGQDLLTVPSDASGSKDSLYLRRRFTVPDPTRCRELVLRVRASGGWIAYLNGTEWCRFLAGAPGTPKAHDSLADEEGCEWTTRELRTNVSLLRPGENILAIHSLWPHPMPSALWIAPTLWDVSRFDEAALSRAREALKGFREVAHGVDAAIRALYFEGGILERFGAHLDAERLYAQVHQSDPSRPEPALRLAACLQAQGRTQEAADILLQGVDPNIPTQLPRFFAWIHLSLGELGRSPADILSNLPPIAEGVSSRVSDAYWALQELADGNSIRVNCGGVDFMSQDGKFWSKDRFFLEGMPFFLFKLRERGLEVESSPLYETERFFGGADPIVHGYEIPVPKGAYKVTLHFVEGHFPDAGSRSFDVRLEGKLSLENYEPLRAGFGVTEERSYVVQVDDGALNIDFGRRVENPKISAIEVERI